MKDATVIEQEHSLEFGIHNITIPSLPLKLELISYISVGNR